MSFRQCIANARAEGKIDLERLDKISDLFEGAVEENAARMPKAEAERIAGQQAFDAFSFEAKEKKRVALIQARKATENRRNILGYKTIKNENSASEGIVALMDKLNLGTFGSVKGQIDAVRNLAYARISNILAKGHRNLLGQTRNKANLENAVRESFGEDTGDAVARELSASWADGSEYLRRRFNAAGGHIPKRADWNFPTSHNADKIRTVAQNLDDGYQIWRDELLDYIDLDKMIDSTTGLPFTRETIEIALKDMHEAIVTENASRTALGFNRGQGKKALRNTRADHRFLVFKDADSWLQYQKKFGNDNIFETMVQHIETMSRDIGVMEVLGPNPHSMLAYLENVAYRETGADPKAKAKYTSDINKARGLYQHITGAVNSPINPKVAQTFAGMRQLISGAFLGATSLIAITDLNFQRIARRMAGLPQTSIIKDYLKYMNPLGYEERAKIAISQGLIADGWAQVATAQMRFIGDVSGTEITRRISDFTMNASLLSPHTTAGRWAFGMSWTSYYADAAGKTFDQLTPENRETLLKHGINEADWDAIRQTAPYVEDGAEFLTSAAIDKRTDLSFEEATRLSTKWQQAINAETDTAIPTSSARGAYTLYGESRPGTLPGEILRSFAQFKNFGVTVVGDHFTRAAMRSGPKAKGLYMADLIISTTLMGALGLQLKEIAKGRDPRPMDDPDFWMAAMLAGGGFGIYGDFLFSDVNRHNRGLGETVAGPVIGGLVSDLRNLSSGNVVQALTGEDPKLAKEMLTFAARYTPGSSIWYLRTALERMVFDQMRIWADPDARSNMRRLERLRKKEYGQRYWWRPGQTAPSRAPDIGAAAGDLAR